MDLEGVMLSEISQMEKDKNRTIPIACRKQRKTQLNLHDEPVFLLMLSLWHVLTQQLNGTHPGIIFSKKVTAAMNPKMPPFTSAL